MGITSFLVIMRQSPMLRLTDCINGTLMKRSKMPRKVNYTRMLTIFASEDGYKNKIDKGDVKDIPFDMDLMIYKETKLKMNHEGCSNSLSEECTLFHNGHGKVMF